MGVVSKKKQVQEKSKTIILFKKIKRYVKWENMYSLKTVLQIIIR